jgi:signal transduction histidine kinase/ActR/RegA family two-component response regulator
VPPEALVHFERAFAGEETAWVGSRGEATFECRLTPLRSADGAVAGVIGVASDISDRREAEETRLALERRLLEAQKAESLALLAGGVAHDFNNLLACVLGGASLVAAELPSESAARHPLQQIEKAARRGSDLTRQMLAYAGRGTVALERVDVNAVVEEMRDILRVSLGARVTVQCEPSPGLPLVEADPVQTRQVVMNLLINASESIGGLDGTITVRTGRVTLDWAALRDTHHAPDAAPGPHVYIEVTDTGCGMDGATLARIFDPFFSTKFAGRGLGLAAVLGIVRGHRGALEVRSAPGRGTTFRVMLPCGDAPVEGTARPSPSAGARGGRTILLVDDEEDVRAVTAHMLERLGWSVIMARDGREGVEVYRRNAPAIDAVILDVTLPRLSGDRAFLEIRGIRPDARVILMSGYDDERTRPLTDAGLAGFLRKPFSVGDLRSTMDRALGNGHGAAD